MIQVEDENHVQGKTKHWVNEKHVAFFLELEQFGILREASDEVTVIGASGAASAARQNMGGRPRAIADQKRARAELEDRRHLKLKRLRVHVDNFQR